MGRAGAGLKVHRPAASATLGSPARVTVWSAVFVLLLGASLVALAAYLFSPDWVNLSGDLPVDIRSPLMANYAADPNRYAMQPVNLEIVAEALADQPGPAQAAPDNPLATLVRAFTTSVPTITPLPQGTQSATRQPTAQQVLPTTAASPTRAATASGNPTRTPEPSATVTVTSLPTNTAIVTRSSTPTTRPAPTEKPPEPAATHFVPSPTPDAVQPTQPPPVIPTEAPPPEPTTAYYPPPPVEPTSAVTQPSYP